MIGGVGLAMGIFQLAWYRTVSAGTPPHLFSTVYYALLSRAWSQTNQGRFVAGHALYIAL